MRHNISIFVILFACIACANICYGATSHNSHSLAYARHTLAVADSLRVNEGRLYDDSLAIVDAYATFGRRRLIYPDDYARACYYYGYLLRQHNNQVAAMQAFIAGSHAPYVSRVVPLPWFSNYHILGRIYSNMGTMSHLADEFELSYDMYELSARSFYKADDTTAYYYALNAMALELAELNQHDETLLLLDSIERNCTNQGVLTKLWETRAILYRNFAQYDSAIYSVKELYARGYYAATGYVVAAQAFDNLGQCDSALFYAKKVMLQPYASSQDKYHMLYILINYDSSIDKQEVQTLSAERADLDAKIIEPLLQQLSAAVVILQQNLDTKPHYLYLCFILVSICLMVGVAWVAKKRIKRVTIEEQEKHQQLTKRNTDIRADIEQLQTSNETLRQENNDLQAKHSAHCEEIVREIENNSAAIRQSKDWKQELHWKDYNAFCETVDHHFMLLATKLKSTNQLGEKEIRLCILVLLEMDNTTIAQTINYAPNGIGKYKYRTAQKLGTTVKNLRPFLIKMAIGR